MRRSAKGLVGNAAIIAEMPGIAAWSVNTMVQLAIAVRIILGGPAVARIVVKAIVEELAFEEDRQ